MELPLKNQEGRNFRLVVNRTIEEQCDAVSVMARRRSLDYIFTPELMEEATIEEAVWSSVIEGAFTSKEEAAKLIHRDEPPQNRSAHFYFVYIHPFTDGNGRTARALAFMMLLLRTGYDFFKYFSISGIIAEERKSYYKSMRKVEDSGDDMTYFVDFYSAMLQRSVSRMEEHLLRHVLAERVMERIEKDET